jgi:hypothetical protein
MALEMFWCPELGRARASAVISFAALPRELLPASSLVDFLHLVALGKPAVRVKIQGAALNRLAEWCERYDYKWVADMEGFCCVAYSKLMAEQVLTVDRCAGPHELDLGLLLGYPLCCCKAIAALGESRIDEHALDMSSWEFQGSFRLIDPSGYTEGASLVCHLPCSRYCEPSLEIAICAGRFLRRCLDHPAFASWSHWARLL